jgi:hypothetical protein
MIWRVNDSKERKWDLKSMVVVRSSQQSSSDTEAGLVRETRHGKQEPGIQR